MDSGKPTVEEISAKEKLGALVPDSSSANNKPQQSC
jgi:hypothetical protein